MTDSKTDFIQDLGSAVRQNPLSAALIGMGVVWLFTGGKPLAAAGQMVRDQRLDRIPKAAGDAYDAARSTLSASADAIGGRVTSATNSMSEGAATVIDNASRYGRDYAESASEYVSSLPGSGAEIVDTVRENLSDIFRAQPLALGAIGIAIGAGIAAAMPPTNVEANFLGQTSDSVKTKAAEFATEQADRITTVAGTVVEAITEEAQKQGLTFEAAKSATGEFSAKVRRIVETAEKGISDRVAPKST